MTASDDWFVRLDTESLPADVRFPKISIFTDGNGSVADIWGLAGISGEVFAVLGPCEVEGTAFREMGLEFRLAVPAEVSRVSSLERTGDTSDGSSGEAAGDTGETKVSIIGVLTSSFWYSGVGGLCAPGRAPLSAVVSPESFPLRCNDDCSLSLRFLSLELLLPMAGVSAVGSSAGVGRMVRPGRPPAMRGGWKERGVTLRTPGGSCG